MDKKKEILKAQKNFDEKISTALEERIIFEKYLFY